VKRELSTTKRRYNVSSMTSDTGYYMKFVQPKSEEWK